MRQSPSLVVCIVFYFFGHQACAQDQPHPSQTRTPSPPLTNQAPEEPPQPNEAGSTAPASVLLPEGAAVKLRLLHPLNSKTVVEDDPLNFSVAEDVVVGGKTLIKSGATAIGRVQHAKPARTMGRGAELTLEMQYIKAGQIRVPVRGTQARAGQGKKGATVALVVVFGVSGLVKHGSEIEIKEGSIVTAYVDRDTKLPVGPAPLEGGQD